MKTIIEPDHYHLLDTFEEYIIHNVKNISKKDAFESLLNNFCNLYIDYYRDYNYNFETNGEASLLSRLSSLPFETIFDVGANNGKWTQTANKYFQNSKFHTFEITKSLHDVLQSKLNGDRYVNNRFGLSDSSAEITYRDFGEHSAVNSTQLDFNFHRFDSTYATANVVRGDDYCINNGISKIDFLKIDVEGHEPKVLEGFSNMLKNKAIRIIQFEYGYVNGDVKFLMKDFYNFFNNYGYIISRVVNGPNIFTDFTYDMNDFKSGPNYIAIHKTDSELFSILTANK